LGAIFANLTTFFWRFCKFDYIFFEKRGILTTFSIKKSTFFVPGNAMMCKKKLKIFKFIGDFQILYALTVWRGIFCVTGNVL